MKNISEFLNECMTLENQNQNQNQGGEETITDEKSFREAARAKFEAVFGDELDEKKMKETIDGLLNDHKDLVEKGEWAELIGILNQSFGD